MSSRGANPAPVGGLRGLLHAFLAANHPASLTGWQIAEKIAALGFIVIAVNKLRKIDLSQIIRVSVNRQRRDR